MSSENSNSQELRELERLGRRAVKDGEIKFEVNKQDRLTTEDYIQYGRTIRERSERAVLAERILLEIEGHSGVLLNEIQAKDFKRLQMSELRSVSQTLSTLKNDVPAIRKLLLNAISDSKQAEREYVEQRLREADAKTNVGPAKTEWP